MGHNLYLKLQAYDKTVLQREAVWSCDADVILSRHVAPTKHGFTDAAIKQILLSSLRSCCCFRCRTRRNIGLEIGCESLFSCFILF